MTNFNKSILLFGGSFDPVHKIHFEILKESIKLLNPEKIVILPTFISPFKNFHFISFENRKKMLKILFKNIKNIEISDFEKEKNKKTYTYEVVNYFYNKYPNYKIYFLMGSDSFNSFHKWKNTKEILSKANLLIAKRKKYPLKKSNIKKILLRKTFDNISSTESRFKILFGEFNFLDEKIKKYILKNKLYFSFIYKKLKKMVNKKRLNHIKQVTKLAIELSYKNQISFEQVSLAALLHDCAKDLSIKRQEQIIKTNNIKIPNIEKIKEKNPGLLHQYTSSIIAEKKFNIKDKVILKAIKFHSTSYRNPSKLSKLLYVADFSSYERKHKESLIVRKIAFKDLNEAYYLALKFKQDFYKNKIK